MKNPFRAFFNICSGELLNSQDFNELNILSRIFISPTAVIKCNLKSTKCD